MCSEDFLFRQIPIFSVINQDYFRTSRTLFISKLNVIICYARSSANMSIPRRRFIGDLNNFLLLCVLDCQRRDVEYCVPTKFLLVITIVISVCIGWNIIECFILVIKFQQIIHYVPQPYIFLLKNVLLEILIFINCAYRMGVGCTSFHMSYTQRIDDEKTEGDNVHIYTCTRAESSTNKN